MIVLDGDDIFSLFVLLVATAIFIKAIRYNWKNWKFYNHCEITKAQLVPRSYTTLSQETSLMDEKTLRYVNSMGKVVTFKTRWVGKGEEGQEFHSDGIEIIYDPDNPDNVKVNNFWGTWLAPLVALLVTFIIFMIMLADAIDDGAIRALQDTYQNIIAV